MYITMPKPTIKCSKCGSADIAVPEQDANGPARLDDRPLLRCRACGHQKLAEPKMKFEATLESYATTYKSPTEETF